MSSSETKSYGDDANSNDNGQNSSSEESKTSMSGRQTNMSKSNLADGKNSKRERMTGVRFADQVDVAELDIGNGEINKNGEANGNGKRNGSNKQRAADERDDSDVNYTSSERDTSGMNTYMRGGGSNTTSIITEKAEGRGDQRVYLETEGDLFHQKVKVDNFKFMARLCEVGTQHEDIAPYLIKMIKAKDKQKAREEFAEPHFPADYTTEERNTIMVGFKQQIAGKRTAIRTLDAIMENAKYARYNTALELYKTKLTDLLLDDLQVQLDAIQNYVIDRKGNGVETETFFLLFAANLSKYQAIASKQGPKHKAAKASAKRLFGKAEKKAETLFHCNSTYLNLGLSLANYAYEIDEDKQQAIKVANEYIGKCQVKMGECSEDEYVEAAHLMELIKENLAIWKGEDPKKVAA